jgi:Ribonuclease G/E
MPPRDFTGDEDGPVPIGACALLVMRLIGVEMTVNRVGRELEELKGDVARLESEWERVREGRRDGGGPPARS